MEAKEIIAKIREQDGLRRRAGKCIERGEFEAARELLAELDRKRGKVKEE